MLAQRKMAKRLDRKHHQDDITKLLQSIHDLQGEFVSTQKGLSGDIPTFMNQFSSLCDQYGSIKARLTLYIPQSEIDAVELEVVRACQIYNDQLSILDAYTGAQETIVAGIDEEVESKRERMAKAKLYNKNHKFTHDQIVGGCVMLIPILGIGIPFTILSGLVAGADILASALVKHGIRHSIASTQLRKIEVERDLITISNELSKFVENDNTFLLRRGFFSLALSRYRQQQQAGERLVNVNSISFDSTLGKDVSVTLVGVNRNKMRQRLISQERQREHELKHATLNLLSAANGNYLTEAVSIVEKHGDNPLIMNGQGAFSIDKQHYDGTQALLTAIHKNHNALARLLLSATGINVNSEDGHCRVKYSREDRFYDTYNTPLTASLGKRNTEMAAILLDLPNININLSSSAKQTPLICAVRHSAKFIPTILEFEGVDVNAKDCDGRTALHYACFRGCSGTGLEPEVVMLLRAQGLNADPIDLHDGGWTPLMYAANRGDMAMVKALISVGANPVFTNQHNMNAKRLAELHGHESIAVYIGEMSAQMSGGYMQRPGM